MALRLCHDESFSNGMDSEQTPCVSACYECLLTYSNQLEHRLIDRRLILDYLDLLATSTTKLDQEPDYEEQYRRLMGLIDPHSSLEREFLHTLRDNGLRLPDTAQNRPTSKVLVQPDFYYERENRPGVCIFIDGPHHNSTEQQMADSPNPQRTARFWFSGHHHQARPAIHGTTQGASGRVRFNC